MDQEKVANALGVTLIPVDVIHKFLKAAVCGNVKADVQERPDTLIFQRLTYQELLQMQRDDPVLGVLWTSMDKKQKPSHKERARLPPEVRKYIPDWDPSKMSEGGLLYRTIKSPLTRQSTGFSFGECTQQTRSSGNRESSTEAIRDSIH